MKEILLLGDSLIADNDWQARMPSFSVYNRGVPGIMVSDLLRMLPEIKTEIPSCDLAMVMIGTNDLLTGNYDFFPTIKKILVELNQNYSAAEILINGLCPMRLSHLPGNTIESINCHIEAISMQTGCCYLDSYRRLLSATDPIFTEDGVHLTEVAYDIWTKTLLEHIAFLIEDE